MTLLASDVDVPDAEPDAASDGVADPLLVDVPDAVAFHIASDMVAVAVPDESPAPDAVASTVPFA